VWGMGGQSTDWDFGGFLLGLASQFINPYK